MTREEAFKINGLSKEQKEQLERSFDAITKTQSKADKANGVPVEVPAKNKAELTTYLDTAIARYNKNQEKKKNNPKKITSRDIQKKAIELCTGRKKKLTFAELLEIINDAVDAKVRKAKEAKIAELKAQLAELEAE